MNKKTLFACRQRAYILPTVAVTSERKLVLMFAKHIRSVQVHSHMNHISVYPPHVDHIL